MSGEQAPPPPGRAGNESGPEAGIFGNLPRTRPAVRSPRRAAAVAPEPEPTEPTEAGAAAGPRSREAEVEAIARAGISLAGDAATLGLKVAGRAAAALRDAVERR